MGVMEIAGERVPPSGGQEQPQKTRNSTYTDEFFRCRSVER